MDALRTMYCRTMYAVPVKRAVFVAQVISSIGAHLVGKRDRRCLLDCQVRLLVEEAAIMSDIHVPSLALASLVHIDMVLVISSQISCSD